MWIDGLPRPDHGPGIVQRACRDCGAGWVGAPDDPCAWCAQAAERQLLEERKLLLDPPWLRTSAGDLRYEELSEIDRAIWDRTRGQSRGTDSVEQWVRRLGRAVQADLITKAEADGAIDRLGRRDAPHGRAGRPQTAR